MKLDLFSNCSIFGQYFLKLLVPSGDLSMEELINTVNQLQDVFLASGYAVHLPQVVVIGSQSAGKSSILEQLVGKPFLPRGPGVVTRCPLVLQLLQTPKGVSDEYAIFTHDQTKVFTDFKLICREIQDQTIRLAGSEKKICSTPIVLKVYSSAFLNLTLVDLPGLTKIPVGDQPEDIERLTRDLTLQYIKNPDSIILAVTPGNADMATSESLAIAREVDPEGKRTLVVVTKLDLLDEGTDAWDVLTGKIIPVKLGIIGVINRSQRDIMENKSMEQVLKDEANFFHRYYRKIERYHGLPYLRKRVQTILIDHIKQCLPKLKESIIKKMTKQKLELKSLESDYPDKPTLLVHLLCKFSKTYCSVIKGNSTNIQLEELSGGARIKYVFQESLAQALRSIDPLAGLSVSAILTASQNASGPSPALFVPEVAFELLMKKQIQRFREPCLQCVNIVNEELSRIMQNCLEDPELSLQKYPNLQRNIACVINDLLRSRLPLTQEMVNHFIDIQLAYINTAHPDFLPNVGKTPSKPALAGGEMSSIRQPEMRSSDESIPRAIDKSSRDCLLIQELIQSYFTIISKAVLDTLPKIIMHFMVNFVIEHLQSELISKLYNLDVTHLLQESLAFLEKQKELSISVMQLEKAAAILNKV